MRIYWKLIIIILVLVLVPLFIVSYVNFYNAKISLEKETSFWLNNIADQRVGEIEQFFAERRSDVTILGLRNVIHENLPVLIKFSDNPSHPDYIAAKKELDVQLSIFQNAYKYVNITLTDSEGKIRYIFNPSHNHELHKFIPDKNIMLSKVKTGIYVGDIHKTGHKEHPFTLCLLGRVSDKVGNVIGIVSAELDMNIVFEKMRYSVSLIKSEETLLISKFNDNKIIYLSPLKFNPQAILTKEITLGSKYGLPAQKAVSGKSGSGISIDYRGKKVLSSWRPIPSLGWGLVTKVDQEEALSAIYKLRKMLIVIFIIVVSLMTIFIFIISKTITGSIIKVRNAAVLMGEGNLDTKIEVRAKDEIGDLAVSFNRMAESLKQKQKDILSEKYFTENIISSMIDTLVVVNSDGMLRSVNKATCDLLGYTEEELIGKDVGMIFAEEEDLFKGTRLKKLIEEGSARDFDMTYVTKSGERIPVSFSGSVLYEEGGTKDERRNRPSSERSGRPSSIVGVVGVARDMRETKRLIADLEKAKAELEQGAKTLEKKVEARTKDLVQTQEVTLNILEDLQESKDELEKSNVEIYKAKEEIESFSKGLEEKVKQRTFELNVLYEVSNAISYTLDYQQLLKLIMESLFKIVDYDICASLLFDTRTANITLKPAYPQVVGFVDEVNNNLVDSIAMLTGENARKKQLSVFLIPSEPDVKLRGERQFDELRSFFNVPFIVHGKTIGMINVSSCKNNAFSEEDIKLIYTIANQASHAIERLQTVITAEKSKMESMVESMSEGVIMIDEKGQTVVLNPQARRMLGFGVEEDVTSKELETKMRSIDLDRSIQECQNKGKLVEKEIIVPVGTKKVVLNSEINPVKSIENKIIGIVTILRDITKEKEIDNMKTEFISTVSHELRTPMTTIRESVAQVLDGLLGETTEQQREFLSMCLEDIDRLPRIINNLLDISKIEARRVELKRKIVDIVHLAKTVVSLFQGQAKYRALEIKTNFSEEQIEVYIDSDRITQVFTNLVGNALKFTEKGYIEISVVDKDKEVECKISDTGIGVSAENLPKLFNKFQQFGRVNGPGEKGTGLGLSIAKGIVVLHKGKIWVESELNKGSKFIFTLPKYMQAKELFKEYVADGLRKALDEDVPLAVLVFEVKKFDDIKEKIGEEAAKSILDNLGKVLAKGLRRKADKAIKSSHSVFIMLPETNRDDALRVEGRLKQNFYDYLTDEKLYDKVEIKCRMASFPEDGDTEEQLLEKIEEG